MARVQFEHIYKRFQKVEVVRDINIDIKIATLIQEIWLANIETTNSCQNNSPIHCKHIWIEFASFVDFEIFINILSNNNTINILKGCIYHILHINF